MKPALRLNITDEDDEVQSGANVTQSGTFVAGDFKINQNGYEFMERNSHEARSIQKSPRGAPDEVTSLTDLQTLRALGQGSSGVVQKVLHSPTNRVLALKVVPLNLSDKNSKQIITELKTLHSSQCPYIVSFHGAFYKDHAVHLIMEYMDGGSLLDMLKSVQRIEERHLSRIAAQVLKGLSYLHTERCIIHRDIKPSNILLNTKGAVKIADFGVSGEVGPTNKEPAQKVSFVGTVTYMSPERIQGKSHGYDSDIWSLALALVECALGYFPYRDQAQVPLDPTLALNHKEKEEAGEDGKQQQQEQQPAVKRRSTKMGFWDIMERIVSLPPPQLPKSSFSPEFCSFVQQCLQKDSSQRPSAQSLLNHPWITKHEHESESLASWIRKLRPGGIGQQDQKQSSSAAAAAVGSSSHNGAPIPPVPLFPPSPVAAAAPGSSANASSNSNAAAPAANANGSSDSKSATALSNAQALSPVLELPSLDALMNSPTTLMDAGPDRKRSSRTQTALEPTSPVKRARISHS